MPGNKLSGGKGNPHARSVNRFRSMILECTSEADYRKIWRKLIDAAKKGEPWAVREFLDRIIGRAVTPIELDGCLDMPSAPLVNLADVVRQLTAQREAEASEPEGNGRW